MLSSIRDNEEKVLLHQSSVSFRLGVSNEAGQPQIIPGMAGMGGRDWLQQEQTCCCTRYTQAHTHDTLTHT